MNRRRTTIPRTLNDGAAYNGQKRFRVQLPGVWGPLSTTVTTGVIASSLSVSSDRIAGFSTRFGSTFDEYRILGVRMAIIPLAVSVGMTNFWFDEKSSATPTNTESLERVGKRIPNNSADPKSCATLVWRAKDLLDLQYTAIGTVAAPVYFKTYTDTTNFGAPIVSQPMWLLNFQIDFEFRGLKST